MIRKIRRRKPAEIRKDVTVRVRLSVAQRAQCVKAADAMGLDLSSWVRMAALGELQRRSA